MFNELLMRERMLIKHIGRLEGLQTAWMIANGNGASDVVADLEKAIAREEEDTRRIEKLIEQLKKGK